MKLTDLAILDWVLINNTPHKIQAIDSIDAEILADDELYYVGEDRCHSEDKIEPIPLTPEILEKNGFIKVNSQRYDYGYPDTDCYVKVNLKKNMIHVNGRNANSNLYSHSFVHELQHALRLCGLNELADNFKVYEE